MNSYVHIQGIRNSLLASDSLENICQPQPSLISYGVVVSRPPKVEPLVLTRILGLETKTRFSYLIEFVMSPVSSSQILTNCYTPLEKGKRGRHTCNVRDGGGTKPMSGHRAEKAGR